MCKERQRRWFNESKKHLKNKYKRRRELTLAKQKKKGKLVNRRKRRIRVEYREEILHRDKQKEEHTGE